MAVLFAVLSILLAILMVILLEIEVDIRYRSGLLIVLHINILAIELKSKSKKKRKNKSTEKKKKSALSELRKNAAYMKLVVKLIESSDITVNEISVPEILPDNIAADYAKNASGATIISLFLAYLSSKAATLNAKTDAYNKDSEHLVIDLTLKTKIFQALKSIIIVRKRLSEANAEDAG